MRTKRGYSQRIIKAIEEPERTGLGIKLAQLCVKRGYSVAEVADVLKISRQTIYNWFNGALKPHPKYHERITALIEKIQQLPTKTDE